MTQDSLSPYMRGGAILAAVCLVLDQISKWLILNVVDLDVVHHIEILPFFSLTMVWNKGISMGLLQMESDTGRWLLIAGTAAVTVFLVHWLRKAENQLVGLSLGAIIGGAIGNIIDRFAYGAVADFVHLHAPTTMGDYSFWVFNVADAGISLGVVGLLIDSLRGGAKSPKRDETLPDSPADGE